MNNAKTSSYFSLFLTFFLSPCVQMEEVRQAVDRLLSDTALCANPAPATIEIGTEQQQQQQGSGDFDWGGSSLQGTKMNRGDIAAAAAAGNTEKTGEEEEEDSMRHMIDGF